MEKKIKTTRKVKLEFNTVEWIAELASSIILKMIDNDLMPREEERCQQLINILIKELEKWALLMNKDSKEKKH